MLCHTKAKSGQNCSKMSEKSKEKLKKIKFFLIAGEPSGDVLGGKIMSALKDQISCEVEFIGIGGPKMEEQGLKSIFPLDELSLMGFVEILPHIPRILKRINQTVNHVLKSQIDALITIDSPDFCFRVVKKVNENRNSNQIKKIHLIAPSVWAYREGRAEKISKLYDLLLAILPFEPPYFEKYGLKTKFIGHPIVENNQVVQEDDFCKKYKIKQDDLVICATPGSRMGEVKRILPIIAKATNILLEDHPNILVIIPAVAKTKDMIENHIDSFATKVIIIEDQEKYSAFARSNIAIAKSGTNTLELSIAKLPMVVIYKVNFLTYFLLKMLVRVKLVNIINLIFNKEIIPELLQDKCNPNDIARKVEKLISTPDLSSKQVKNSQKALEVLGLNSDNPPSKKAATYILECVNKNN